jgi:hypothetical protein
MSRSNYDKPFYVDIGTSIVAIRCASNHDVLFEYDYLRCPQVIQFTKDACDRMNKEAEVGKLLRNCDVGTPEEQEERRQAFCDKYKLVRHGFRYCYRCPLRDKVNCTLAWAHMVYEKEGEKNEQ